MIVPARGQRVTTRRECRRSHSASMTRELVTELMSRRVPEPHIAIIPGGGDLDPIDSDRQASHNTRLIEEGGE